MVQSEPFKQAGARYRYEAVRDALARRIESGELRPGDRLPTFVQIQRAYGVTPATVHRACTALAEAGLVVRRRGSGVYVADRQAPPSRLLLGMTAGPDGDELRKAYWAELMSGITKGAGQAHVVLAPAGGSLNRCDWLDGLLLASPNVQRWCERGEIHPPAVSMLFPVSSLDCLVADDFDGARRITQHLLYLGHRRIAFLTVGGRAHSPATQGTLRERERGYQQALRDAGIEPDPRLLRHLEPPGIVSPHKHEQRAARSIEQWLAEETKTGWRALEPTAIVALNDDIARGAIAALQAGGLRVPDDVSVTGFDGLPWTRDTEPRLSTVQIPLEWIGADAAQRLRYRIAHRDAPVEQFTYPVELCIGNSTGPCPAFQRKN